MKVCIRPHYVGREPHWEEHGIFYSHCVGPGWQDLLNDLTLKLEALGWDGYLDQVKEKFGTLRFYWCNNIKGIMGEIAEDVVENAESRTAYVCETCGKSGKTRGDGWVVTACEECWNKRIEAKNKLVVNALVEATSFDRPVDGASVSSPFIECDCTDTHNCEAHRA